MAARLPVSSPSADPRGRECHRGQRLSSGRRARDPTRPDGRKHQYRCGGSADPGRCTGQGWRGQARPHHRFRHAEPAPRGVALGPDLPPLFTDDETLAADFLAAASNVADPLWRLPLWDGYDEMLKSDIADLVNAPEGGFAGRRHRRAVPASLRADRHGVGAYRHLRLAPLGQAGAPPKEARRLACAPPMRC